MSTTSHQQLRRGWTVAALVACLLLIGLDTTMAYLALPELMVALPIGDMGLRLTFVAYFLVFGALLVPLSKLGDRIGRRRLLLAGLTVFGLGAAAAAFATGPVVLVTARAGMGAGAAVIMPTVLAMLPVLFAPAERPRALAGASAAVIVGVCLGPLLGGWLLEYFWWGSVFLVHVPVVAIAIITVALLFPEARDTPAPVPATAAGRGRGGGWPSPVLGLVYALLMGVLFVVTPYLQGVGDASGIGLGLRLLPLVVGLLVGVGVGERLAGRIAPRVVVAAGMGLVAAGLVVLATADAGTGTTLTATVLAAVGAGSGMSLAASLRAATAAAPGDLIGVMRRTTAVRQIGAGVGVAILGVTLVMRYRERLTETVAAPPDAALKHLGGALAITDPGGAALHAAARLAYVDGLRAAALVGVAMALIAMALPFLIRGRPAAPPAAVQGPEPKLRRAR